MTAPSRIEPRDPVTSSHVSPISDHRETWKFDYPIFHAETREQWRAWLTENAATTRGVWLCSWRTSTDRPRCPYPEAVEEAICFGWIDSTTTILDDDRGLQLYTPRKGKSAWTRLNRERAADMEARGLMADGGRWPSLPRRPTAGGRFPSKSRTSSNRQTSPSRSTAIHKPVAIGTPSRPALANRCCGGLSAQHELRPGPAASTRS